MMTTFPHRSPWAPGQVLMQAGKVVLFMRLLCSLPVILSWADAAPSSFEIVLVCITTAISLLLILAWSTVIPFVMRHPSTVMADVCLSTALVAAGRKKIEKFVVGSLLCFDRVENVRSIEARYEPLGVRNIEPFHDVRPN